MRKKLFYNDLISLFVESYSLVSVCCLINFGFIRFDSFGHGFHSVMCIFFTTFMMLRTLKLVNSDDPFLSMITMKQQDDEIIDLWQLDFMFAIENIDPRIG